MPRETQVALKTRARAVLGRLAKANPDWGPTLEFSTPFELLVAAILAAQARDERVNQVTRRLFQKYPAPLDYLLAGAEQLEQDIRETGFFRQKAKAIRSCVGFLLADHYGVVPSDMDSLLQLPGVGRKTASIVLGNAFKVPAIAVDRHVARVADRLSFSRTQGADATEMDLRTIFPPKDWVKMTWCLVLHGRRVCRPTPLCYECPISGLCPYPKKTKAPAARAIRRSSPQKASTRRSR